MVKLSVNVNKIATLRNTRELGIPSIVKLSALALDAGAAGITVHPRPDERHIRPHDVDDLAALLKKYPGREFNIEGNPFHGMINHCRRTRPTQATLVPDSREAFTSNHGWNLAELAADQRAALKARIADLKQIGCRVSLFMDPVAELMAMAKAVGADRVELYTEPYAARFEKGDFEGAVAPYAQAADAAHQLGLGINAGHDLNLQNLRPFLARVKNVDEVSIGHALIADALEIGMPETVSRYVAACGGVK